MNLVKNLTPKGLTATTELCCECFFCFSCRCSGVFSSPVATYYVSFSSSLSIIFLSNEVL